MRYSVLIVGFCLAACTSGGGSGAEDDGREPYVGITPEEVTGPSGSASYSGQLALAFTGPVSGLPVSLDGDLTLEVDFDRTDDAVTGFASGFADGSTAYTGTLFLSPGALDDSGGGLDFAAQLSGTLQQSRESYLLFGDMGGEFLGDGQEAATGRVAGTVRQSGIDAALSGQFQAARQN